MISNKDIFNKMIKELKEKYYYINSNVIYDIIKSEYFLYMVVTPKGNIIINKEWFLTHKEDLKEIFKYETLKKPIYLIKIEDKTIFNDTLEIIDFYNLEFINCNFDSVKIIYNKKISFTKCDIKNIEFKDEEWEYDFSEINIHDSCNIKGYLRFK